MTPEAATLRALLAETVAPLVAEVRALREQVARLEAVRHPEPVDPVADLLAAIWRAVGNRTWTVREILTAAESRAPDDLATPIVTAAGSLTPHALGRLLPKHDGTPAGSFLVERAGECRDGAMWTVRPQV